MYEPVEVRQPKGMVVVVGLVLVVGAFVVGNALMGGEPIPPTGGGAEYRPVHQTNTPVPGQAIVTEAVAELEKVQADATMTKIAGETDQYQRDAQATVTAQAFENLLKEVPVTQTAQAEATAENLRRAEQQRAQLYAYAFLAGTVALCVIVVMVTLVWVLKAARPGPERVLADSRPAARREPLRLTKMTR